MKRKLLVSTVVSTLLFGATMLQAKTDKRTLVHNEMKVQAQSRKSAPKEIILGMQNTFKALQELQMKKTDDAKKDLQIALKNFDKALKDNPKLDLVPIDERLQAFEFIGSSKDIQKGLNLGIKLLKEHNTQEAINVISPLKDELDVSIMAIPMKLYPVSVKKALNALNKGDIAKAYNYVAEAMNSLVIYKTVIPTPLLVTQDLINEAMKLDKSKKEDAIKLLEAAKESLNRAELLGYTKFFPKEYKALNTSINAIEKEIKGKNKVEKLYSNLKNDIINLVSKTRAAKVKLPNHIQAEKKVNSYEKQEQEKAVKEAKEFKKEVAKDENQTLK